jgi:hypothetical protein
MTKRLFYLEWPGHAWAYPITMVVRAKDAEEARAVAAKHRKAFEGTRVWEDKNQSDVTEIATWGDSEVFTVQVGP